MKPLFAAAILIGLAYAGQASAQSTPGATGAAGMEGGYGGAGRIASQPFSPTTRDANGNRLVVNGVIMNGQDGSTVTYTSTSSTGLSGASYFQNGADGLNGGATATAIGNMINVSITGHGNTVVLNATQTNTSDVNAVVSRR